ncbi:hypothetical protein V8C35DRAFT_1851 [Trichoderma chlorosporum]
MPIQPPSARERGTECWMPPPNAVPNTYEYSYIDGAELQSQAPNPSVALVRLPHGVVGRWVKISLLLGSPTGHCRQANHGSGADKREHGRARNKRERKGTSLSPRNPGAPSPSRGACRVKSPDMGIVIGPVGAQASIVHIVPSRRASLPAVRVVVGGKRRRGPR